MSTQWIYYFGYGSLVNRDTRPVTEHAVDAHLCGWRRTWSHRIADERRPGVNCTSLTIEPADQTASRDKPGIDGVLVRLDAADLPALDLRESGYERLSVAASSFDLPGAVDADEISIYRSLPTNRHLAEEAFPVLQSYIDCVMAGYYHRFGDSGLRRMVKSTRGWKRSILDDRRSPVYPRHVVLEPEFHQYLDRLRNEHT